jgi:hypothetical protein
MALQRLEPLTVTSEMMWSGVTDLLIGTGRHLRFLGRCGAAIDEAIEGCRNTGNERG